jgi:hypothetical protein
MSQYVESMLPSMGLTVDATGNIAPRPEPGAGAPAPAPAVAPAAPARPAAAPAAQAVTPVKATTPSADVPEPPTIGQPVDTPDAAAAAKKKTLLGG